MTDESTLISLFAAGSFSRIVELYRKEELSPSTDPVLCRVVAGAFFKLGCYSEATELCSAIEPTFCSDIEFISLYGAALRRSGKLEEWEEPDLAKLITKIGG